MQDIALETPDSHSLKMASTHVLGWTMKSLMSFCLIENKEDFCLVKNLRIIYICIRTCSTYTVNIEMV